MLTFFTIPKPFRGHTGIIQRNAIASWRQLRPDCEVILMGGDEGVAEAASEFGCRHAHIGSNEHGTPILGDAYAVAQRLATHDTLVYVNSDIIFLQDLIEGVRAIGKAPFLVCGQRWDLDVVDPIPFSDARWPEALNGRVRENGRLHGPSGLDYFIFPKGLVQLPPFAVGRPGWDNWLIFNMRMRGIPVIDATTVITTIHQNHDYSHSKFGGKKRVGGPEVRQNMALAGGSMNLMTLRDADWVLDSRGLRRPAFPARIWSQLSTFYVWRLLLSVKRVVVERLQQS